MSSAPRQSTNAIIVYIYCDEKYYVHSPQKSLQSVPLYI